MKKIILFIFLVSFFVTFSFGQSLELSNEQGIIPNNSTIAVEGSPDELLAVPVWVTNISTDALSVKVKKVIIDTVTLSTNTFCWNGVCFPSNIYVSPTAVSIDTDETYNGFEGHYEGKGHIGTSEIMYVFFNENNPDDSVCVKVKYLGGTSSVKENLLSNIEFSNAYPNPANTQTSFDYLFNNEFKDVEIIISTLLGSTVRNIKLQDIKGKVTINTSNLKDGVYFYSLILNGEIATTKKLIVRH